MTFAALEIRIYDRRLHDAFVDFQRAVVMLFAVDIFCLLYTSMVQAFMNMAAASGTVDMSILASGMYVAMVTTVGGLMVGIPAYFGYSYLVARIERLVFQREANSIAFMDILNQPVEQ